MYPGTKPGSAVSYLLVNFGPNSTFVYDSFLTQYFHYVRWCVIGTNFLINLLHDEECTISAHAYTPC